MSVCCTKSILFQDRTHFILSYLEIVFFVSFFSREEALPRSQLLVQGTISREAFRSTIQGAPAFYFEGEGDSTKQHTHVGLLRDWDGFPSCFSKISQEIMRDLKHVLFSYRGLLELPRAEDLALEGVLDLGKLAGGRHRLCGDDYLGARKA